MSELSGKVSIITGASSGLGQATAVMFAGRGAMITLCGRDQDRLKVVLDQCTQASGGHQERFITVQGDITEDSIRQEIVDKTVQTFGRLDVVVPNAGAMFPPSGIRDATDKSFDLMFNTNVKSVFFLIQKALPHLEKSKGNIVSVSSCVSSMATCPNVLYPMTKAAVDHMTRCLALDLGPKGIRVNAVNPSLIPTRLRRNNPGDMAESYKKSVEMEQVKQPTGKCGTPDDVAEAVSYLASNSAKFITGQCLFVDGGRVLTGSYGPQK